MPDFAIQVFHQGQESSLQSSISPFIEFGNNLPYLEFYYRCAGPTLSSKYDYEFWSRISLQMAHSEPAVRHALIALTYLNQRETGSLKHARIRSSSGNEHKTLLFHYNRSVRCLIDRIGEPTYSPEIGLVTCLLFICIEFLRANHHTAFAHMRNGLKIVAEIQQQRDFDYQSPLFKHLPSRTSMNMIEDSLVPIFIRGMATALMFGVSVENDLPIPIPFPKSFEAPKFTSILQAQKAYYELRNATIIFFRQMVIKILQTIPRTSEDFQHQGNFLEAHRTWFHALQRLEASQNFSLEDAVAISATKVSYYATYIHVACAMDASQMTFDAHLTTFKELLHHAKIVLNSRNLGRNDKVGAGTKSHPNPAANFTFDLSLILSLFYTAIRCRCPTTRRSANALLSLDPPREGLWDAEQHVAVSKRVIEMEEMEVDGKGWPTEKARLWSSVIDPNMDKNGGFWVVFCPAQWVGIIDGDGKQKTIQEWFVLGEASQSRPATAVDALGIDFFPDTAPLH
ncbi:hypothetical protein IQ07DRAFT_563475 [Pyrenochaeta sp. DS3sAY3a]|nr:hypothetical protein IQ07DRAFT_563475 [Pyrenochaeta sp. DS3sAY3a]